MKRIAFFLVLSLALAACVSYEEEEVRPVYDVRDNFLGSYEVDEYSKTFREKVYYQIYITKNHHSRKEIVLNDLYAIQTRFFARVDHDRITIPLQVSNGYEIRGSGYLDRRDLYLEYEVYDVYNGSYTDFCESVAYFEY